MKWLFILLLLLNAAFFGWQYSQQGEPSAQTPVAPPLDGTVKSLTLLSEVSPQPPAGTSLPETAPIVKTPETDCYALGPFASSDDAQRVITKIAELGFKPNLRMSGATGQQEYWLDLSANDGKTVPDSLWQGLSSNFPGEFPSVRQQPRPCG